MKPTRLAPMLALLTATLATAAQAAAPAITVTCDDADGVIEVGQRVTFTVTTQPDVQATSYSLLRGGLTRLEAGPLALVNGRATVEAKLDAPGALLLDVRATGPDGASVKAVAGAIAAPAKIEAATTAPDDFDAFWKARLDELATVPIHAVVEAVELPATTQASTRPAIEYSKVTFDNVRGTHVRGQIARPKEGEKFPAVLVVQWAGTYPLQRGFVLDRAAEGWLALNINAHDLPIDESPDYYKQQADGPLKNYAAIGNFDKDKSYFLRMYLGVARAIDYLKTRPDWDGRTILVTGSSQGGLQSIIAAALRPDDVDAIMVSAPAGSDQLGPDVGRKAGWPNWISYPGLTPVERIRETSRYYDAANFAPRVRCPALVAVGLRDETAPPESVLAAYNRFAGSKELVVLPNAAHQGPFDGYYTRVGAWRAALHDGRTPPVAAR